MILNQGYNINRIKLYLAVDYSKKNEYVPLDEIKYFGANIDNGEYRFTFGVIVEDSRVWEVALGTGMFYKVGDYNSYPGPYGGWGKPPKLTLKLEIDAPEFDLNISTILLSDYHLTSGIPWPLENNGLVDLEFVKWL